MPPTAISIPSGTTHAYAKAARIGGAEIYLQTRVTDLGTRADGGWDVITDRARSAEHVVNAGGLWAREVGRMVGARTAGPRDGAHVSGHRGDAGGRRVQPAPATNCRIAIDFKAEIYLRQERTGMVLGTYERPACRGRRGRRRGISAPNCCRRTSTASRPRSRSASGISRRSRGRHQEGRSTDRSLSRRTAIRWSGPVPGPAQLLVRLRGDGGIQPGRRRRPRAVAMDGQRRSGVRRLGDGRRPLRRVGDARLHQRQGRENYARRFSIRFPNEELPAARPQQTTALYDILVSTAR